jgi:hypothetical protein
MQFMIYLTKKWVEYNESDVNKTNIHVTNLNII